MKNYKFKMPKISPLPIETKGKNVFLRMWIWLTITRKWRVEEDWFFILPDGTVIVIPAGFIFDGASIPRLFWVLLSPTGLLFIPALIHDFGYRYGYLWTIVPDLVITKYGYYASQKFWDKLFFDVAKVVNGMSGIDGVAYAILFCFGRKAWRKNRREEAEEVFPESLGTLNIPSCIGVNSRPTSNGE